MVSKFLRSLMAGLMIFSFTTGMSHAGEVDLLVQKLVEKGILSAGEARELITETKEEVKKQNAKGTNEMIPAWVQTVKLKGDFRMRYEGNEREGTADTDNPRHRARIRARLGVEAKPNDQMKVGIGIATGATSNARSTNSTLGDDDSYKGGATGTARNPGSFDGTILDYAYGQYTPLSWITLTAGKFKMPIWQTTDLLFDTDTNPEGGAVQLNYSIASGLNLFMNNMAYVLGEGTADRTDPYMVAVQPGFSWNITDKLNIKAAAAYYAFNSVKDNYAFTNSKRTNTVTVASPNDIYSYDYDSINPSVELGIKEPIGGLVPYASIFGDYVSNISIKDSNAKKNGHALGFKFGAEKVANLGDWQFKGIYAYLQRDAFLDIFPDSDRYGGRTNMKSYEGILEYGLGKNTSLALDYYQSCALDSRTVGGSTTNGQERVVQVDWNLKF